MLALHELHAAQKHALVCKSCMQKEVTICSAKPVPNAEVYTVFMVIDVSCKFPMLWFALRLQPTLLWCSQTCC